MRILIVDDDFITAKKLEILLQELGECAIAENGNEAIELFKSAHKNNQAFDLITLDIGLPDIKGYEFLELVREWETKFLDYKTQNESKILMVSAKNDSKNILTSFKKGCEGYLTKPFNKDSLYEALNQLSIRSK